MNVNKSNDKRKLVTRWSRDCIHVCRFMKTVLKNENRALSGRFFLARNSKVDDIKIKRKVSPFLLPLPIYLPFIALLSPFFALLHGLEKA